MDRRSILKKMAVGAAGGVAVPVARGTTDDTSVDEALDLVGGYGDDLLKKLADHGYLDEPSVSEFDEKILSLEEFHEMGEGLFVSTTVLNGATTSRVTARKDVGDHVVELFVHPEADDHYAIVKSKGEERGRLFREDGADPDTWCRYEHYCTDYDLWPCYGVWSEYEWLVCEEDSCAKSSHVGCCGSSESEPC